MTMIREREFASVIGNMCSDTTSMTSKLLTAARCSSRPERALPVLSQRGKVTLFRRRSKPDSRKNILCTATFRLVFSAVYRFLRSRFYRSKGVDNRFACLAWIAMLRRERHRNFSWQQN